MNFIYPEFLKKGDTIGIAATARKVSKEEIQPAIDWLIQQGFQVKLSSTLYNKNYQFAGTDEERAKGFQELLDDNEVKAVLCARGGYGTVRIIDHIDFSRFIHQPKWIIGFSDVTVLHAHLQKLGVASIHGPMLINLGTTDPNSGLYISTEAKQSLIKTLMGMPQQLTIPKHLYQTLKREIEGNIYGGNLSVLQSLSGSEDELMENDGILIIEDIDEHLYHFDRMMHWLFRSGKLKHIKCLIVGHLTKMKNLDENNPFGKSAEEIIRDLCEVYKIPVIFNCPFGHEAENYSYIFGGKYRVKAGAEELILEQI